MSEQTNIQIVQSLYAAFGRGDIDTILNALADGVTWQESGPAEIPYVGLRRGRAQVAQFFEAIGMNVEVEAFEPQEFLAQGNRVVAIGMWQARVRATNRSFRNDWVMLWTLEGGKITSFRSFEDTANALGAFRGT